MSEEQSAAGKRARPAQLPYLELLRLERTEVAIYLTNGVRLQGIIDAYDSFVVHLAGGQLVYKHAIASITRAGANDRPPRPRPSGGRPGY